MRIGRAIIIPAILAHGVADSKAVMGRRRLAAELRAIREGTGKSGDVVAAVLRWSPSKFSRYELAKTGLKVREVEKLLDYYQVSGTRRTLAKDAALKGWWEEYADFVSSDYQQFIGLEHEASSMAIWQVEVEPIAPGIIARPVRVRMPRRRVLTRPAALHLFAVLDESVLRRRVSDDMVMYEQLRRLVQEADRLKVTLHILPLNSQRMVFGESFPRLRFGPDNDAVLQDVVGPERTFPRPRGLQGAHTGNGRVLLGRCAASALTS